jgi:signal transduction histidine kinase
VLKAPHRYLLTGVIIGITTGIQSLLLPVVQGAPFLLYYPAVLLASLYGDGISAILLSALLGQWLFVGSRPGLHFQGWVDVARVAIFVLSASMIRQLTRVLADARRKAEDTQVALRKQNELTEKALAERDRSLHTLATVNRMGQSLVAELDLEKLVQQVTDSATQITGAQFGAFFYNVVNDRGESYTLYSLSGAPKEAFARFPMPRATAIFHPTFFNTGTVRSDDIRKDPRYGKSAPHFGMPTGHLPVVSYLAVSVVSRSGEVLGGLFFGHEKPGVFDEQAAKIVEGLSAQAAVAMDNAKLYHRVQESVRARDEFLSIASHELKTPLTSLKLQAQLRTRRLKDGETRLDTDAILKLVEGDNRQIDRIARLIDDMLDISRITTGKLTVQKQRFDLCDATRELLDRLALQIQAAGCPTELVCEAPVEGDWDRFRVEQVMTNLLTNALRYGQGKPMRIWVGRSGDRAVFQVRDEGMGIAAENHERIFQRFERAISANEISGMGLGLYIARQIVEMHGGHIRVESAPGKGSTFTVELPLVDSARQLG